MRNAYSPYLRLLYDQEAPVGHLGRGTHYSVLRAPCWHGADLSPLPAGTLHDFAIIWDEDHDERIIEVIERMYLAGLLAPVLAIGERKGCLTVLVSDEAKARLGAGGLERYRALIQPLAEADGDVWSVDVSGFGPESGIISASDEEVELYLRSIDLLWRLGSRRPEALGA